MNEMEVSKIVGAGCAALLAYLGLTHLAAAIYAPDHPEQPAYQVAMEDTGGGGGGAETAVPVTELMALVGSERGPRLFRACAGCHKMDENNTGPLLGGVVGRAIAGVEGFNYSGALAQKGGDWTPENLDGFLANPRAWAAGTSMGYGGMRKPEDRAALIAWLSEQE